MADARRKMVISPLWLQFGVLTFLVGFTLLGILAVLIYREQPPIPGRVTDPEGTVIFTADDIMAGQHLFQKYGLMQFGTIFGHGAYLGPDFTAQYISRASVSMVQLYNKTTPSFADVKARVQREFKQNRYEPATGTLTYTVGQAKAFGDLKRFYADWFGPPDKQAGLQRPYLEDPADIHALTAYFSWAAWVCTATRPGADYSYTNNWPADDLVGNKPTAEAFVWSVYSLIALLGGVGLVMFLFGRYNLLGWHRTDEDDPQLRIVEFRPPEEVRLAPVQRMTAWYFLVVAGLFLTQGLLGGANAHYHVEPAGFFGINLAQWFPYNLTRMWHLQLAIFFVATSFLAMGLFLTPMIARRQPKHQEKLAAILFGALVVVVVGSLLGEAASLKNYITTSGPWFWIGAQGWEYLDLGRLWQLLLTVGLLIWVAILVRGMRDRLPTEHRGNLPWLFLYSSLSIPVFYGVGMLFGKNVHFAIMDFWRFWVVHLWVEDFLELFTTIMVAYIFVLLGVVREKTATRVVYLDIIIYSVGGVVGTMHHLYFSGAPAIHMAMGAFFSAMEVIPLLLLTIEAWHFIQLGKIRGTGGGKGRFFPHKWALMFLVAVGFWNFLGAGVFGFLINLPIVSYYEIGTGFTANHAHGAMMGVYGMLAIGFFMFVARYFIPPDQRSERAMKTSFWSLNIGLGWMIFVNLLPMGALQLFESYQYGYNRARMETFFARWDVRVIEWLRLPGDVLFIVGGILPIVYLALRMLKERKRYDQLPAGAESEDFTTVRLAEGE